MVLTTSVFLASCISDESKAEFQYVPLPFCDWPLPMDMRLQINELLGHKFLVLTEDLDYRSVMFIPLGEETQAKNVEVESDYVLELVGQVKDASIYEFKMNHPDLTPTSNEREWRFFEVEIQNARISITGFSISDVELMVEQCQQSRR
jgi:hypothetical protein